MTFPHQVQTILNHLNANNLKPIGCGGEGWVFPNTSDTVLKIYLDTHETRLNNRQNIYNLLNQHTFTFQTPNILEIHTHKNICYTIEQKLPGTPGHEAYHDLSTKPKLQFLKSYFNALAELSRVDVSQYPFGDIIHDDNPLTSSTWTDYLIQKLDQRLEIARDCLERDVPDLDARIQNLKNRIRTELSCEQKSLVHGDYFLGNLRIDKTPKVSAIFDFSPITVVGDTRMDIASALTFLTLIGKQGISKSEYDAAHDFVLQQYEPNFQTFIDLYALYYSIYFADAALYAPDLYAWCLNILRA